MTKPDRRVRIRDVDRQGAGPTFPRWFVQLQAAAEQRGHTVVSQGAGAVRCSTCGARTMFEAGSSGMFWRCGDPNYAHLTRPEDKG